MFPLTLSDIPARLRFHDVPEEPWRIGDADVFATEVSHPGTTIGYRLAENSSVFAYLPDHEPAVGVPLGTLSPDWISGFAIAADATVLVHDAQYSEAEYPSKVGWGHSSPADAVAFQTEPRSDSCSSSTMTFTTTGSSTPWKSGPASYGGVTDNRPPSPAKE